MIHVYHGDGKGKTTAAMGLALRMLAAGRRVVVVQFLKDGESGEARLLVEHFGVPVFASSTPIRVASYAVIATVSKLQLRKQEGGCCKPPDATCLHANTLPNAIELRNPPDGVPAPWGAASLPATRTLPFPLRYGRGCEMPADRARQQGHR